MPFLFKDYTDCVLKAFEEMRSNGRLSRLLMQPTTASIKQDCLNVYNDRINKGEKEEENILRAFFGVPPVGKNFSYAIEKYDPDRFRPLQNLIKGKIENPALATVELLAWLIDYNPRPLAYAQRIFAAGYDDSKAAGMDTNQSELQPDSLQAEPVKITQVTGSTNANDPVQEGLRQTPPNIKLKITIAVSLLLVIILGAIYIPQQQKPTDASYGAANTGCMYWAVDHYEPAASCNEKGKGLLVPLNQEKMKSFRKITRKDTITEWSIGKVYYIKNNGDIECYTEGGNYPEEPSRTLRVLSPYMFDKYLRKNKPVGKDSLPVKMQQP